MAIPAIPTNFSVQQANGEVFLEWNAVVGATSYTIQRSTPDENHYANLTSPTTNSYLDTDVVVGTNYFYKVLSSNADGNSQYCTSQSAVPTNTGDLSLGELRLRAKQRADRVNSPFVLDSEWDSYISQSYFELYDLLITLYEDYFVKAPLIIPTTNEAQYTLPTDFYKLKGVDLGLSSNTNAFVTLKKFNFISRNRFVYPQLTSTYAGVFNLQYRLVGNTLMLIPTPSAGQYLRVWYIPKLTQPLQDTDIISGVSGWTEYIIVDAAIKALQKEESDTNVLMAQKMALIKRINDSASNRDADQSDTISDIRTQSERWGGFSGGPGGDGSFGGF